MEFEDDKIYKRHLGEWYIWDEVDIKEIPYQYSWKFAKGQCEHNFQQFLYAKFCTKCKRDERMCQ